MSNVMMVPKTRYVVTKASDDGTFELGDHITLLDDGAVSCHEANGWVEPPEVKDALKGCEFEVDSVWLARRKQGLLRELYEIAGE